MIITKEIEIDMGHRVTNHKSKCRNLHGHRYRIEVGVDDKLVQTKGATDEGMVIDFGDLKEIMMKEIDQKCDHGFMMWQDDELSQIFASLREETGMKIIITEFIPTAENVAKYWYEKMKEALLDRQIRISHVKVWETPSSTATYHE